MIENAAEKQISIGDLRVVLSLSVLAFTLWIVKFLWEKQKDFKKTAAIPSIQGTGIFGATGDLLGKTVDECFQEVLYYFRTNPEIFKGWLGHYLVILMSNPEHMEVVLTNPNSIDKSPLIEFTKAYMGNGLFSARANIWKRNRKLINPTFNQKVLDTFIPIFSEKCDILMGILEKYVGQPHIDIMGIFSACTVDTVCEAAMGLTVHAQTTSNHYGKLLDKAMELATARICNMFYHPQIFFDMTKMGKLFYKVVAEMNDFTRKVVKERKAIFEQKTQDHYVEEKERSQMKTFLELLLEISHKGEYFSDKQLQDEVNTLMAAGSDTTSASLSFVCMMLGMFSEYQQKVYEEAIEVLGADRYATKEDLPKLKFTEMFIKETLRIFPIAPLLLRIATDDIKLDDTMTIPKDTVIGLGVMHSQRNPKYWKDPLKFNPYRFLPEEWAKQHPYSYLPFSGGPRGCIGSRYAMMLMKLIISKIVRKFRVKTDYKNIEDIRLKINLLMRPTHGFKLTLEHRD